MSDPKETCWSVIDAAAAGLNDARERFARTYGPIIRAYLIARWRGTPRENDVDDAAQDVFVECFRAGGVLERSERGRPGGFRAFLFGLVRNVARFIESGRAAPREKGSPSDVDLSLVAADEARLSDAFDREWARSLLREAAGRQAERAGAGGAMALRRLELLRLRFQDDRPIREIAELWGVDAEIVHREYRKARDEFRDALREVIAFHEPDSPREVERQLEEILTSFA